MGFNDNSDKTHDDMCLPAAAVADAGAVAAAPIIAVATEGAFSLEEGVNDSVLKVLKVLRISEGASGAEYDSSSIDEKTSEENANER